MNRPTKPIRKYGTSDGLMLQFARVSHGNFVTDLADFTALNPDLDMDFADDFLASIDAAENFSSDSQMIDIVAQYTLDVGEKMKQCREKYMDMKYYIELAFPNKPGTWNEFGYNDYERVRNKQAQMVQFMKDVFETATKYSAQLIAKNYTAPKIAELETLANELQAINTTQETAKGARYTASHERVMLLNACWDLLAEIRKAAKNIYVNNWGKWQLYLLPWGGEGGGAPPSEQIVEGTVPYGGTVPISFAELLPESVLTLENIGDVDLRFCGSETPGLDCGSTGIVIIAGDSQAVTLSEITSIGVTPQFLNVSNTIGPPGSVSGEFIVTKI